MVILHTLFFLVTIKNSLEYLLISRFLSRSSHHSSTNNSKNAWRHRTCLCDQADWWRQKTFFDFALPGSNSAEIGIGVAAVFFLVRTLGGWLDFIQWYPHGWLLIDLAAPNQLFSHLIREINKTRHFSLDDKKYGRGRWLFYSCYLLCISLRCDKHGYFCDSI